MYLWNYVNNQYINTISDGNFNQLISSGAVHPTAILIVPYVSPSAYFAFPAFAVQFPFGTAPGDNHRLSLTNLHVTKGGQNGLQSVLKYSGIVSLPWLVNVSQTCHFVVTAKADRTCVLKWSY